MVSMVKSDMFGVGQRFDVVHLFRSKTLSQRPRKCRNGCQNEMLLADVRMMAARRSNGKSGMKVQIAAEVAAVCRSSLIVVEGGYTVKNGEKDVFGP